MTAPEIIAILKPYRIYINREKDLQRRIEWILNDLKIPYEREKRLDKENHIDFLLEDGVGIEIKIKGTARNIYDQCLRYAAFDEIKSIVLLTAKSVGLPSEINGKPAYIFNSTRAWL